MEKVLKFVDEWGNRIMLLLVIIVFMKTCTTNNRIDKLSKKVTENNEGLEVILNGIDSKDLPTKTDMVELIKKTPNWKTLELEELSDKNRIPINKLKNDEEK
jgi:hypothetical protein